MMKFILLRTIPLLFLMSCYSTKQSQKKITDAMNSWIGLSKQRVIMELGLPLKTGSDGAGGEVLLYGQQFAFTHPTYHVDWAYKMFFINQQDKVYHWLVQRSQQPPQQIDINLFIRR